MIVANEEHLPMTNVGTSYRNARLRTAMELALVALCSAIASTPAHAQEIFFTMNSKGELDRPTGYREWVHIGTPVTPNDLNDGKAPFPEFHAVYIDPASWARWKRPGSSAKTLSSSKS